MTEPDPPVHQDQPDQSDRPDWERKRRLAEVFGDVLPDTTADERDPADPAGTERGDAWLEEQVPPHHHG